MPFVNGLPCPTGCYIDGHWGQYAPDRLAEIATGLELVFDSPLDDARTCRVFADYLDVSGYPEASASVWELHSNTVDRVTEWLNDRTESGFIWTWQDGELFLSVLCDLDPEDCTDEECAHAWP